MKNIIIYILFANLIFTQTNFSISSSILDDGLEQNSGTISFLVNTDYDIYGYQFSIPADRPKWAEVAPASLGG